MEKLLALYLVGKKGIKGPKTKMCTNSMRFCEAWPTLPCGLYTVIYTVVIYMYILDSIIFVKIVFLVPDFGNFAMMEVREMSLNY